MKYDKFHLIRVPTSLPVSLLPPTHEHKNQHFALLQWSFSSLGQKITRSTLHLYRHKCSNTLIRVNSSSNQNETMTHTHKLLKCTLLAAVLIVSFHLIFIARDTFQLNSKARISQKLNCLQNNVPISKLHNKETVSIDTRSNIIVIFLTTDFQTWRTYI